MRFFTAVFLAVAALAAPAFSAPASPLDIQKFDGPTSGKYIVILKDGVSKDSVLRRAGANATDSWDIINGFAGEFGPDALKAMRSHPDVDSIFEDAIMTAFATQNNAPWGLGRLSSPNKLTNQNPMANNFIYNYAATGGGVDIYVVDTGVRITHQEFGRRARWGANFITGSPNIDENGHGTHCAGTAAGIRVGVAKEANVIAVKVLDREGNGPTSSIISGLDWVAQSAAASRRPSIASFSIGTRGGVNQPMDDAARALFNKGVHVIVAAGNENVDARLRSPSRVPEVVTVGASTISDAKASFSNWGPVIDIFAPGDTIYSASNQGDSLYRYDSGTSMATPQVSGLVAYLIQLRGPITPTAMSNRLKQLALQGQLSGLPAGTPNMLANNIRA